ncbi:MAG: rod shape-determining protein MreD [Gammaproteobacteria bacterium]|nr:rod shape-determining protein MreD [Gammaproteobacteria bacterium]
MNNCYRIVSFSIVIALMLAMLPLPDWAQAFRPDWVAMVLIYWVMALPQQVGVTFAWVSGLLLDVTLGSILGQHAIGLVLVSFLVLLQYKRIRVFSLFQQSIVVFILLIFKQIIVLWVSGIVGQEAETWSYFLPSLIGAMIWPWVFTLLRNIRRQNTRTSQM